MVKITSAITIERLILAQLLYLYVNSVTFEVNSDNMDESNSLQLLNLNLNGDDWDKFGLFYDMIIEDEREALMDENENDLNLVSQVLPVIVLQQNPDMIEQATMAYLKLLERRRAQKLFNEVYNERRTVIMQQLERGENIYDRMEVIPAFVKRQPVRRCGTLLIKHIQKVCNGCLRSSTDSNTMVMTKRISTESRNRLKRGKPSAIRYKISSYGLRV
uniref:Uncharacterized protein n=1 Tax=Meloidogyne floridensis TaxID=298350 RepID=A0A915PAF5_9BILA